MIEFKSSQNLLIPNDFLSLQYLYNAAVQHTNQTTTRSPACSQGWSQVCHPLGQLLAYMVDNGVRFGALCSASKTFFVFFDGQNDEIGLVRIMEAYITAQRDFLKAWASFVQEARKSHYVRRKETQFSLPKDLWIKVTPPLQEDDQKEGSQVKINRRHQDGSDEPDGTSQSFEKTARCRRVRRKPGSVSEETF
jgi:hypothetical protein